MKNDLHQRSDRAVATWIFIGLVMLIIQVMLGGITRLTGSGLSITEWDVVTGALPPLNDTQWMAEFDKYRQTQQFRELNFDFTLRDFKFIFFWEWFHRLWGRLIGVAFAIPFVIFIVQKRFRKEMVGPLIILFLLGALQGVVGWVMVLSGFEGDAIYVAPVKLAMHFLLAMVLVCYTFWFGLELSVPKTQIVIHRPLRKLAIIILVITGIQLGFGALMAGLRAAPAAHTWPDINGYYIPPHIFPDGLASLFDDRITVHFIHRNLAYLIFILVVIWSVKALRLKGTSLFRNTRLLPLMLVLLQVILGILTVIYSLEIAPAKWVAFEWFALIHQLTGMLFLLSMIRIIFLVRKDSVRSLA